MQTIVKVIATLALATCSLTTFAAKQGFYVGGQLGLAKVDTGNAAITSQNEAGGIYGGYNYQIASKFLLGAEVEFNYLGQVILPTYTDEIYGTSLTGNLTYLMTPKFSLFAKAGVNKQQASRRTTSGTGNSAFTSTIGVGYNWTENWETRLSFQHIAGTEVVMDNGGQALTYNNVFLSLQYNF